VLRLIGGSGDRRSLHRTENTAHSPLRYVMDPKSCFRSTRRPEAAGPGRDLPLTPAGAYPSQTGINLASGWPDSVYIIVSLENADI
jgi:hypothetical protein